jgi:hypothetical protein
MPQFLDLYADMTRHKTGLLPLALNVCFQGIKKAIKNDAQREKTILRKK